jgi:hypothetical protein
MLRSSSPNTNHDGLAPQRTLVRGLAEGLLRDRPLRRGHACRLRRRHVRAELGVESVDADGQVRRPVAASDRLQRLAQRAAGEHPDQRDAALAGLRRETGDVHKPDDVAGVGVDVRDHGRPVGVRDEHHRPLDRADQVADGLSVRGEATQRVGGGDHAMTRGLHGGDDAIPARRLGEGAVDEHDRGWHHKFLRWAGMTWHHGR